MASEPSVGPVCLLQRLIKFFGRSEQRSLAAPSDMLLELFGVMPTASGQSVTPDNALRSPTLLAAVRCIAEAVGSLPIHVFRRGPDGTRERERDHPVARLLSGRWAPWLGSVATRTAIQLDALLHRAGYGLVVRTAGGQPVEIHRIDPRRVRVEIDELTSEPTYFFSPDRGGQRRVGWQDMLVVQTPGSLPDRPISLLREAREAIALELASIEHEARLFGSGARPSGVLKVQGPLSSEAARRLRESWNAAHAGGANSGRTAILESGTEFEALTFSSVDLQFIDLRQLAIEQIAAVYGVPLPLIGSLDRAVWNSVTELNRQFLTMTLSPWLEIWQSAIEIVLIDEDDLFVEFETADLLRADISARFEAYRKAAGGAWMTADELRMRENLPPLGGAAGELILQAGQQAGQGGADAAT
jgi:HK97 family phage portal protein